jgi:hypothetical protein
MINIYGTGSCPESPQGWHLEILLIASQNPLKGPCLLIASIA